MKTIEQAAKEYADKLNLSHESKRNICRTDFAFTFIAGVEFAQRWIPVEEELPICFESGNWDGLRSDFMLVKFEDGSMEISRLYKGSMDGLEFQDWYDRLDFDFGSHDITHWRPINLK